MWNEFLAFLDRGVRNFVSFGGSRYILAKDRIGCRINVSAQQGALHEGCHP